jgi:hypothetical protein
MQRLQIFAGLSAYTKIRKDGLSPEDVGAIFGASGAAKWLTIAGLDKAIFGQWLADYNPQTPIDLFGTSVGAFKLAAAAQDNPADAIMRFASLYAAQRFSGDISAETVAKATENMILDMLGEDEDGVWQILANPKYYFHCGAVRCHGTLNTENATVQRFGMAVGFMKSMFSDKGLDGLCERTIFSDPRSLTRFKAKDGFQVRRIELSADNLARALIASGSIPVYMNGVDFPQDSERYYRDGGLLDYHPVPSAILPKSDKLVLYPHFYPSITRRWFDKFFPWKQVDPKELDNVVIIAPNDAHINSLPDGRIPDRRDFVKFQSNEALRISRWQTAVSKSEALGDEFLRLCETGDISDRVRPIV